MEAERASLIDRLTRLVAAVEDTVLVVILASMILLAGTQIFLRNVFHTGLLWADPGLRVMVLWVGMIGAMVATRFDKQISVDALSRFLTVRWRARVRVVTDLFTAVVSALLAWHAARLVLDDKAAGSVVFASVPVWVCEAVLPIAFSVIAIRYLMYAVAHARESRAQGEER
jgi:TRAP-type C4-dicarboxylate transport system permease small subunit